MRRSAYLAIAGLLLATAAGAGTSHYLDRAGVLWSASSQPDGLVLAANRDGAELLRTTVPFADGATGGSDSGISVAADELTGKVTVVWQRNWSAETSEVMLGVWNNGAWERVTALSTAMSGRPRYPEVQLTRVQSTVPDPAAPGDPSRTTVVEDSFLHVVWWTGSGSSQHGEYGLLRLTAGVDEGDALSVRSLDDLVWLSGGCLWPPPQTALEHPLFASQPVGDRAFLFHGSRRACMFQLLEIHFEVEETPSSGIVTAMRRRHTPVFGVRKLFAVPNSMSLEGARFLLGTDLNPVAYRVLDGSIEYISSSGIRWTPKRSLPVGGELTVDRAIPLVEHLVR